MQTMPPSVVEVLTGLFANGCFVSEPAAASALGISPTTLRREAERGSIEFRIRGKRRCYAREDLEAYLTRSPNELARPARERQATRNRPIAVRSSSRRGSGKADAFSDPKGRALLDRLRAQKKARQTPP